MAVALALGACERAPQRSDSASELKKTAEQQGPVQQTKLQPNKATLSPSRCWDLLNDNGLNLQCFYWQDAHLEQRSRALRISSSLVPAEHLLIYVAGGPGLGALTAENWAQYWLDWYAEHKPGFDLLIYDAPGVKGSSAYWRCSAYENTALALTSQNISLKNEVEQLDALLKTCLYDYDQRLKKQGLERGLHAFNALDFAESLQGLVNAMAYDSVHLWGVSYGTRVAMLAGENKKVKSLVLDGVYPLSKGGLFEQLNSVQRSYRLHQRLAKELMGENYDYLTQYQNYEAQLKQQTQTFRVQLWPSGEPLTIVLTPERLYQLHFQLLYAPQQAKLWYRFLQQPAKYQKALQRMLETVINSAFDRDFNSLLAITANCQDAAPVAKNDYDKLAAQVDVGPFDWQWWWQVDICGDDVFAVQQNIVDRDQLTTLLKNKRILISGGRWDPVTPSAWAHESLGDLNAEWLLEFQHQGHASFASWPCAGPVLDRFVSGETLRFKCKQASEAFWQLLAFDQAGQPRN
ncbi:alpha/beta fold hydrolase [Agaribacterium haliotis]|uniref:alpha/beta fold hydrolase n=1 Tax=Agaribacterium haliotis TaxID=2013869 RepID=UPI0013043F91|nr:alpha/beta fold hydrolase [Agaribacterium haliotis]